MARQPSLVRNGRHQCKVWAPPTAGIEPQTPGTGVGNTNRVATKGSMIARQLSALTISHISYITPPLFSHLDLEVSAALGSYRH